MNTLGTISLGFVVCIVCVILKGMKSNYTSLVAVSGAITILISALDLFSKINSFLSLLQEQSGLPTEYGKILLKILGVCLLGDLSISLCRDENYTTLGDALETFCKCSVILIALPIFEDVMNMIGDLLK